MFKYYFILFLFPVIICGQKKSLSECINIALDNNLNIQKNRYNKKLQEIEKKISKKDFLPSVNANISNNFIFGVDQDIFGVTKRNDNFNNNAAINSQFLLYNGGKIRNSFLKESFEDESSFFAIEAAKRDISIEVLNRYLQVLLNKEMLNLAVNSVEKSTKIFQKTEKAVSMGFSSTKILLEAKASLYKEKQRLLEADSNVKRSLLDLAVLLQVEQNEEFDIKEVSDNVDVTPFDETLDEVLTQCLISNPKLKSLELKSKSLNMQTEVLKSLMKPTVSLNTYIGTNYFNSLVSEREKGFWEQYKFNLYQQFRIGVNIPIFNKGINKLQVEKNKINEDIGINTINTEKQVVTTNVKKIFFEMSSSYENFLFAKEVENNIKQSLDLTEKSYAEGYSTLYEFNADFNNWIEAVNNMKKYKYGYLFNSILLRIYSDNIEISDIDLFIN